MELKKRSRHLQFLHALFTSPPDSLNPIAAPNSMDFVARAAAILGKEEKWSRLKENFCHNFTKTQKSAAKKRNPICHSAISSPNNNKIPTWNFAAANAIPKRKEVNVSSGFRGSDKADVRGQKSLSVAPDEILGSSELGLLKNRGLTVCDNARELKGDENVMIRNPNLVFGGWDEKSEFSDCGLTKIEELGGMAVSNFDVKIRREKLLEDARESAPEIGCGRVMHLVEAFEKILSIPKSGDTGGNDYKKMEGTKEKKMWVLPGFQPPMVAETQVLVDSKSSGLHLSDSSHFDSREGSSRRLTDDSEGSQTSSAGQLSGTAVRRKLKAISQRPFNQATKHRASKMEELLKKGQGMKEETEEKKLVAESISWSMFEPESVVKHASKERTIAIYLAQQSDVRALKIAEFDHQMAETIGDSEQLSVKREKQQNLAEEEKIKGLGKDLVFKAQSTPSFNRPCISSERRQLRSTYQKPFNLRTEQRGRTKKEEFFKKVQAMITEEEKQRVQLARSLPWTTYDPGRMVKPPVKQGTRPTDLVLHSDIRAKKRAKFDHQVAEKMSVCEQYRSERERQQKLVEEEEIKRLRKGLFPKARPMPYFDRLSPLGGH